MKQDSRNGEPAYRQIQNVIREQIQTGQLRTGDIVESERELARIHQVSLMTARHALADLAREGIVQRRHGAGTFVAPPKIHFNKLTSYTEQMASRAMAVESKLLDASVLIDPEIAARLGLAPTAPLVRLERVRSAGGEPFALEACYLPGKRFSKLQSKPWQHPSLFSTLEYQYGIEILYADEEVDGTAADLRTAELLGTARGAALLRIRQIIYSNDGKSLMYVFGLYRSERHTLTVRRYR
jgi:GntR family transcriptional regulator